MTDLFYSDTEMTVDLFDQVEVNGFEGHITEIQPEKERVRVCYIDRNEHVRTTGEYKKHTKFFPINGIELIQRDR